MSQKPQFRVELKETRGSFMETKPRYEVLLNGKKVDELYFNMTGYRGALPTIYGSKLDLGESAISTWRKEIAAVNREASQRLTIAGHTSMRIIQTVPTENKHIDLAVAVDAVTDEIQTQYVSRSSLRKVREIFRATDYEKSTPLALLNDADPDEKPRAVFADGNSWVLRALPDLPHVIVGDKDYAPYQRVIGEIIETKADGVFIAISRNEDGEPDAHFVDSWSGKIALSNNGTETRLSDMREVEGVPVARVDDGHFIRDICPWFDPWAGQGKPWLQNAEEPPAP